MSRLGILMLFTMATDSFEVPLHWANQASGIHVGVFYFVLGLVFFSIQEKYDVNVANDTRGITGKLISGYSTYFLWKFYEHSSKFI